MRDEITRAGSLLQRLGVPQAFAMRLAEILAERYKGHWHADAVARGQAFRCLRSTTREVSKARRGGKQVYVKTCTTILIDEQIYKRERRRERIENMVSSERVCGY